MKAVPLPKAFSLVEVTLALAVISFCLLTLVALLPIGMNSTRDSVQRTIAAGIASQIAADLRDTPLATSTTIPTSPRFGLTLDTATTGFVNTVNTFYLDDSGNPTGAVNTAKTSTSIYKATVIVTIPKVAATTTSGTTGYSANKPTTVRVIITWPAQADSAYAVGSYPTKYQGYFETVTAVDRN